MALIIPAFASAKEVTYAQYMTGTPVFTGDTLVFTGAPDNFYFANYSYYKYEDTDKYYLTSYGSPYNCETYLSNNPGEICPNDYTLYYGGSITDLVLEHLIEKIDIGYDDNQVPVVYYYEGYQTLDFEVNVTCDKSELQLGEKATCQINMAYSVAIPTLGNATSNGWFGEFKSNIAFNTKGDEVKVENFDKNPALDDEQGNMDYNYSITLDGGFNYYNDNYYYDDDKTVFFWYNPGIANYDNHPADTTDGRYAIRHRPYGVEAYIGEFEVTPEKAEGIVRDGAEDAKLDYDAKVDFEFSLFNNQGTVDYVYTKGFKLKNYITENGPEEDPDPDEDPIDDPIDDPAETPDETPEVKPAEENPKTGLPNYIYLLVPMALLAIAYLVINKVTVFKHM